MPAAAVRQEERALFSMIGRKGYVGVLSKYYVKYRGRDTAKELIQLIEYSSDRVVGTAREGVKSVDTCRNFEGEGIQLVTN